MPLSDLFKKSPKKKTTGTPQLGLSKSSTTDDSLLSPEMQKKRWFDRHGIRKGAPEKVPLVGGKRESRDNPGCRRPFGRVQPVSVAELQ